MRPLLIKVYSPDGEEEDATWLNSLDLVRHLQYTYEPPAYLAGVGVTPIHRMSRSQIFGLALESGLHLPAHARLDAVIFAIQEVRAGRTISDVTATVAPYLSSEFVATSKNARMPGEG